MENKAYQEDQAKELVQKEQKQEKLHKKFLIELEACPKIRRDIRTFYCKKNSTASTQEHSNRAIKNKETAFLRKQRVGSLFPDNPETATFEDKLSIMQSFCKVEQSVNWKSGNRIDFRTKNTDLLYKKLMRDYSNEGKNNQLIEEICRLYRALEISAQHNERINTNEEFVRENLKIRSQEIILGNMSLGCKFTGTEKMKKRADKEFIKKHKKKGQFVFSKQDIKSKVLSNKRKVRDFYRNRQENLKKLSSDEEFRKFFFKIMKLTPWMAYFFRFSEQLELIEKVHKLFDLSKVSIS